MITSTYRLDINRVFGEIPLHALTCERIWPRADALGCISVHTRRRNGFAGWIYWRLLRTT
jgi:hypothetical protein